MRAPPSRGARYSPGGASQGVNLPGGGWARGRATLVGDALLPALIFAAVAVVAIFPMLAADTLGGDDYSLGFPILSLVKGFALSGDLPLWNPYRFSGVTLIANPGNALFYPLTLPLVAFSTDIVFQMRLTPLLHLILIGYFTYTFLRQLGVSREGGIAGGLVFMLSGAVLSKFVNGNGGLTWTFTWIPLTLYLLEKTIRKPDRTKVLGLGVVAALQILAGYPGTIYYAGVILYLPYLLGRLYRSRQTLSPGHLARLALVLGSAMAIGLLLSGRLLLASLEIASQSTRQGGLSYETSASLGLPLPSLITLVFPWFWGGMGGRETYWGTGFFDLTQVYVGLLPLFLVAVALLGRRTWLRTFFLLAGTAAVLLAISESLPFYRLFYFLPGASLFRHPFKFLFIFSFAAAALTGMGFDDVVNRVKSFRPHQFGARKMLPLLALALPLVIAGGGLVFRKLLVAALTAKFPRFAHLDVRNDDFYPALAIAFLAGAAFFLALAGRIRLPALKWLLLATVALDLGLYGAALAQNGVTSLKHESDPVVEFLKRDGEPFRIYSVNSQATGVDPFGHENRGMEFGIQSIDGYDPVVMRRYEEYANVASGRPIAHLDGTGVSVEFDFRNTRMFDLLNVKYMLSNEPMVYISLERVPAEKIYGRTPRAGDVYLYVNREMFPRFALFDRYEAVDEPAAILGRLARAGTPLSQALLLEETLPEEDRPVSRPPRATDAVEILSYTPNEIRLKTSAGGRRLLFASEMYYPGWRATVDGVERKIYRANYLFRAVAVEGGEHEVVLSYQPGSFRWGLLLAGAGAALLLAVGLSLIGRVGRNRGE